MAWVIYARIFHLPVVFFSKYYCGAHPRCLSLLTCECGTQALKVWIALVKNSSSAPGGTLPLTHGRPLLPPVPVREADLLVTCVAGWAWWITAGSAFIKGLRWIRKRRWADGSPEPGWARGKVEALAASILRLVSMHAGGCSICLDNLIELHLFLDT